MRNKKFGAQVTMMRHNPFRILRDTIFHKGTKLAVAKMEQIAEEFVDELVTNIERQDGDWVALNEDYLAQKEREGLDRRILIATGDYLASIKVLEASTSFGKGYVSVGVEDKVLDSGISMRDLSMYLEYGTSKMPARPHWRPLVAKYRVMINEIAGRVAPAVIWPAEEILRKDSLLVKRRSR